MRTVKAGARLNEGGRSWALVGARSETGVQQVQEIGWDGGDPPEAVVLTANLFQDG